MTIFGAATFFPLAPDGAFDTVRTRAFLTSIQKTASGREVRLAHRLDPVKRIEFKITLERAEDLAVYLALWYVATERLRFLVPLWGEHADVVTIPSSTQINIDTTDRDFVPGGKAVLYLTESMWQVVDVLTVASDHVTLAAPLADLSTWSAYLIPGVGALTLAPCVSAWLNPPTREQRNPEVEHVALTFDEELGGIAGIDDGVGEAVTPVATSCYLEIVEGPRLDTGWRYGTWLFHAFDASGQELQNPIPTWTITQLGAFAITAPEIQAKVSEWKNGQGKHIEFIADASTSFHVVATYGAVSDSANIGG